MQMILVAAFIVAIATMACGPSATTSESDSGASQQQPEESGPALLLSEESAISILQVYLQDCLDGWDSVYANRVKAQMRSDAREAHYEENPRSRPSRWTPTPPLTFAPVPPSQLQLPSSEQEKKSWLIDLATGTTGDIAWSAQYHGVTELGRPVAETWVVIGPGLERGESRFIVLGRWKVRAGYRGADYLDAPARLALEEYDSYHTCP